ncbi:bifunctional enoyl-CoA hydratase/phosphate acetyltransferase [Hoeflea prorocentri]|uniref:Bifunctional enoyl-CoA hydratase/phosphate acetyltransferase n=1 Tax=Hoeflea prorocentri TaxID=1922333 RepID=A0A9X3ZHV8_9HYPH|nr:bifunctional enoyl-CoA hydratase/phosphate acetyltransferase [Hoeflea prorocentri]MCY6381328.1 bifunctional enoyl-CoA hydratase/phosphate acetyltransferase [Hoeflea prorocentri]MDA5399128.1 bifunctional enoyl-CoA hydratase/phosphate acetyltransferase [Hoeflea prorocentri]
MISDKPVELPAGLMQRAKGGSASKAVIVGAHRDVVIESVRDAVESSLIVPVLVGETSQIKAIAGKIGFSLDDVELIEASGDEDVARKAALRASQSDIGMVVKGHVHTDAYMSALLKGEIGIRQSGRRMTHCFHMTVPGDDRPLIITDAAVNIAPDATTKKAAIVNAVGLARAVGIERPRVAILSATETPLPQMPSSMEAAELSDWAATEVKDADVCGPLAFDNAVSPAAAELKGIENPVAGHADILLVPNIETGNALFKMMVYFSSACAAGVVLGGRIPIVLTSRADPAEARLASVALAKLCSDMG